jgi:hypothetical protein
MKIDIHRWATGRKGLESNTSRTDLGPKFATHLPSTRGSIPGPKCGRNDKLTTHLHIVELYLMIAH